MFLVVDGLLVEVFSDDRVVLSEDLSDLNLGNFGRRHLTVLVNVILV